MDRASVAGCGSDVRHMGHNREAVQGSSRFHVRQAARPIPLQLSGTLLCLGLRRSSVDRWLRRQRARSSPKTSWRVSSPCPLQIRCPSHLQQLANVLGQRYLERGQEPILSKQVDRSRSTFHLRIATSEFLLLAAMSDSTVEAAIFRESPPQLCGNQSFKSHEGLA